MNTGAGCHFRSLKTCARFWNLSEALGAGNTSLLKGEHLGIPTHKESSIPSGIGALAGQIFELHFHHVHGALLLETAAICAAHKAYGGGWPRWAVHGERPLIICLNSKHASRPISSGWLLLLENALLHSAGRRSPLAVQVMSGPLTSLSFPGVAPPSFANS